LNLFGYCCHVSVLKDKILTFYTDQRIPSGEMKPTVNLPVVKSAAPNLVFA